MSKAKESRDIWIKRMIRTSLRTEKGDSMPRTTLF